MYSLCVHVFNKAFMHITWRICMNLVCDYVARRTEADVFSIQYTKEERVTSNLPILLWVL